MRFEVGDVVRIAKNSWYYGDRYNTKDMNGICMACCINKVRIDWEDGRQRWYYEEHLKLRSRN